MERLTYESERGFICIKGCTSVYSPKERKSAPLNSAIVRLFAYENTGVSPGALEEMLDDVYDLGYQACLTYKGMNWSEAEELQRYRDAKAKGRRLMTPSRDKQTNADRIRAMSDEELAELFGAIADEQKSCDLICGNYERCKRNNAPEPICKRHYLEWLQQPAEGGGAE